MKSGKQFRPRSFFFGTLIIALSMAAIGQEAGQKPEPTPQASTPAQPTATFKANANMVTIEVVVRDKQGHSVPGLTAKAAKEGKCSRCKRFHCGP